MSAKLDFCAGCGGWIGADTGTMRQGPDGEAEIICDECLAIEQNTDGCLAETVGHDCQSGLDGAGLKNPGRVDFRQRVFSNLRIKGLFFEVKA
jgi:hypothetical protein